LSDRGAALYECLFTDRAAVFLAGDLPIIPWSNRRLKHCVPLRVARRR